MSIEKTIAFETALATAASEFIHNCIPKHSTRAATVPILETAVDHIIESHVLRFADKLRNALETIERECARMTDPTIRNAVREGIRNALISDGKLSLQSVDALIKAALT
jgi:hypothetical protein